LILLIVRSDYVQQKKDERKEKKGKTEEDGKDGEEPAAKKQKKESNANANKKDEKLVFPPGVVISFKGIGGGVTREILKEEFGKFGAVAFVDFQQNESDGFVRMSQAEDAKKAVDDIKANATQFGGKHPDAIHTLEGSEETAYWQKINNSKCQKNKKGGKKRKRF